MPTAGHRSAARSCLSMTSVNPTDATDAEDREELTWETVRHRHPHARRDVGRGRVAARHRGGRRPGRAHRRRRRCRTRSGVKNCGAINVEFYTGRRRAPRRPRGAPAQPRAGRRHRAARCWWSTTSPTPATPCAWSARCWPSTSPRPGPPCSTTSRHSVIVPDYVWKQTDRVDQLPVVGAPAGRRPPASLTTRFRVACAPLACTRDPKPGSAGVAGEGDVGGVEGRRRWPR